MNVALLTRFLVLCALLGSGTLWAAPSPAVETHGYPTLNPPVPTAPPPYPLPEGDPPGTQWSIGQPTDEEQLYLEFINRARANPSAEGVRLATTIDPNVLSAYNQFGVDLNLMQSQFASIPPAPPLAMNAQLLIAARLHSGDMFTNQFQGHYSSGTGFDPGQRITAQGYAWQTYRENVFANAKSVWYGHAGFNVDWGPGVGGMQTPPGHRMAIHTNAVREVGIGIVNGVNGSVGPQVVTQDFGTRQSASPLISGVVYFDFNANNFYDLGEGIGGVTVIVPGSTYWARTTDSGGYAVPVTTNGNYAVSFSAPNLTNYQVVSVTSLQSRKVDLRPVYSPPVISGPNPALANKPNVYTFSAVSAATAYDWEVASVVPYTAVEGAETGYDNVTVTSPGTHPAIEGSFYKSGSYSFHLANPNWTDESIMLNAAVKVAFNSTLNFWKKLSWAASGQVARAQVSRDGGVSWGDVWSQAGNNESGETEFSYVSTSLAGYSGDTILVRFLYDYTSGGAFTDVDPDVGLRVDDISIANAELVSNPTVQPAGNSIFVFTPPTPGEYQLRVRARINSRTLPFGPAFTVTANMPPPTLQSFTPVIVGNQVQIEFQVNNHVPGMTFSVLKASVPDGAFSATAASFQVIIPGTRFRATVTKDAANSAYYRILGMF